MDWAKSLYARIGIVLIFCLGLVYVLFFKPNPLIRVNINKLQAKSEEGSALTIQAPSEVSGVGKKFTATIEVDTKGYTVNAVQSYLEFDPHVLEITKTSTDQSFCKFYPENNYNNDKGILRLACGTPYPGFSGKSQVLSIEFISKAIRPTEIKFTKDSMVLANDGKGTNLLSKLETAKIQIKAGL